MTKRKTKIQEPVVQLPSSEEIGYTVGEWAGKEQYRCKQCQFDTLDLDAMLEHLLLMHSVVALKEPVPFPPSASASPSDVNGTERADGVFEIDLKEDQ